MADRPDKDELDRAPAPPKPPNVSSAAGSSLPLDAPEERSLEAQRKDIADQVAELEGSLRFMGSAHPQRSQLQARLEQLRAMLEQIEGELKGKSG